MNAIPLWMQPSCLFRRRSRSLTRSVSVATISRSTMQVTNRSTPGFVSAIKQAVPDFMADVGHTLWGVASSGSLSIWRSRFTLPPGRDQPLRATTSRQVGSCCDRSRSNVQISVISVTASVPVNGRPSLSLV
jgi:hypothetical protein